MSALQQFYLAMFVCAPITIVALVMVIDTLVRSVWWRK